MVSEFVFFAISYNSKCFLPQSIMSHDVFETDFNFDATFQEFIYYI